MPEPSTSWGYFRVSATGIRVLLGVGQHTLEGSGAESLDEPVLLKISLTPIGDHQPDDSADATDHGKGELGDIDRAATVCAGWNTQINTTSTTAATAAPAATARTPRPTISSGPTSARPR